MVSGLIIFENHNGVSDIKVFVPDEILWEMTTIFSHLE